MSIQSRILPALPALWFFITAIIGLAMAYHPATAWFRFGLIVLGLILLVVFARLPEQSSALEWTLALLPIAVLIYFLLTNDWTARIGKLQWLDPLLVWLAAWQPSIAGARLDSNSLGGVLASLMPLQIAAVFYSRVSTRTWIGVILIGATLLGLFLSESRGAWIAVAVIAWLAAIWWLSGRLTPKNQRTIWIVAVALIAVVGAAAFTLTPLGAQLLGARTDRVEVWRNSFDLATDYAFTGLGLGGFEMAYSSYALLVHVGHTIHAHDLFLDIWLEQGILGLIAFSAIILTGIANRSESRWRFAALASVGIIVLHGFLDDAFYGYGGIAIPLLFVPLGMLLRAPRRLSSWVTPIVGAATLVALAIAFAIPTARAQWFANLGALSQTRAELSVYQWPQWSFQDQLRRSPNIDLNPAIENFQSALALDPKNATADRRLGQIALSRGEYDQARDYLIAAYASAPNQRATAQMLGESFAIAGQSNRAAELWRGLDLSAGQLTVRQWWYESLGDQARVLAIVQATPTQP